MGSQTLTNPEFAAPQGYTQQAADNYGSFGAGWHGSCHGPRHETHKEFHWQGTGSTSGFDNADQQLGDTGRLCYTRRKGAQLTVLVESRETFPDNPLRADVKTSSMEVKNTI